MKCFLSYSTDYLDDAVYFSSVVQAVEDFRLCAEDLARFEQKIEATIHIAPTREEVVEYPDYVLSLGPRGGVKKERA